MMLNIKLAELIENHYHIIPAGIFFGFVFMYQLLLLLSFEFELFNNLSTNSLYFLTDFTNLLTVNSNFCNLNSTFTNIKLLGFVLFSNFLYHFFIAGLILLLAMISAIVLTLQKRHPSQYHLLRNFKIFSVWI